MKKTRFILLILAVSMFVFTGCTKEAKQDTPRIKLLMELPTEYNTPDGAALDKEGNVILAVLSTISM